MSKTLIFIIGIFLVITLLILLSSWQFKRMAETLSKSGNALEFKGLNTEEIEKMLRDLQGLSPNEATTKEFISPDRKLKMNYRSDWFEIKEKTMFERIIPKERLERYGLETIFLAQKIGKKMFAQLEVSKMGLEKERGFTDVIEMMKEDNRQNGWEMKILLSTTTEEEMVFQAEYKKAGKDDVHSIEKMLLYEIEEKKKVYLVSFITFEINWRNFEKEATEIINSAQLI